MLTLDEARDKIIELITETYHPLPIMEIDDILQELMDEAYGRGYDHGYGNGSNDY